MNRIAIVWDWILLKVNMEPLDVAIIDGGPIGPTAMVGTRA